MSWFGKKAPEAETTEQTPRRRFRLPRLKVWQRLFLAVGMLVVLAMLATPYVDFRDPRWQAEEHDPADGSGFRNPVTGYVVADEGEVAAQLYTEGLSPLSLCGRGTALEMESWEPYVAENGTEYYYVYHNGSYAYILCKNVATEQARVLLESQVYVRTTTNLFRSDTGTRLGSLVEKGTVLRVLDYDYVKTDGSVNMYQVRYGDETGWISSQYVALNFVDAMVNWSDEDGSYANHVSRGDRWGAGDAADLDYFPREKGDFSDLGNVMPDSCYSIYIPAFYDNIVNIDSYLELAEGTQINTFVFTIQDNYTLAFPSQTYEDLGILDSYGVQTPADVYAAAIQKVQDAGYYTVARMTVFQDEVLASAFPAISFAKLDGSLLYVGSEPWVSPYSRDAWKIKMDFAVEAVERFGFNEIQLDYVQFPYGIADYTTADLRNQYNESMAQAIQRFLMYATDVLHAHNTYVGAVVYGETAESYVNSYGHYWPAISTVVDVMSATPYPESYGNYYTNGSYYRSYQHPYSILSSFAYKVTWRQRECGSPAVVRTWIQTWDQTYYNYDNAAIQRQILGLYDNDITGGYMPWNYTGDIATYEKMLGVFNTDYYSLWEEAEALDQDLSDYMQVSTSDDQEEEEDDE